MDTQNRLITVITPTIGRPGLDALIASLDAQACAERICHIVLWDDSRTAGARAPTDYDGPNRLSLVLSDGFGRNGEAPGSPLRAVGLMAASTPWVTFADDDVTWAPDHAETMLAAGEGRAWCSSLRRIVAPDGEDLGIDLFESVGDDPSRRVAYEMCDGNTIFFRREFGVAASPLFRETQMYDDDRRMYGFLKTNAGPRGRTGSATIRQVCPERLTQFFRENCSRLPPP